MGSRRARLGQKLKGIARVYDHVTPAMVNRILDARGAGQADVPHLRSPSDD
ncbi:hypothetical protein [Amycolatopsis solani]|uniref:hypothetical protein n=1 Tax=Amycolatopsis solani TaxID=3028615 RepID=UPI003F691163